MLRERGGGGINKNVGKTGRQKPTFFELGNNQGNRSVEGNIGASLVGREMETF